MGDDALVGRLLDGRYRIGEKIARGGMASVFLGTDERLDREVAIKVMHRGLGDPDAFTERFKREAKAAAKLNHRNVVSVFDQGHDGDAIYLVMEYVPGSTLRDLMAEESPMSPERTLDLIEPVLVALSAAHQAHLIHRDIKPENVLITPDGEVKVADFGLARAVSQATTATSNTLIGTVSYLAPEIVSNTGADARSDVYAVGAMMYEMLTGIKPHSGDSPIQVAYKHVHQDIGAPSKLSHGIPPYVDALVARATVRDRNQRAADAGVLLQYVRLVQDALAAGEVDDPELTHHLQPAPGDGGEGEPTVSVPLNGGAGAGTHEPTVQWRQPSAEPAELGPIASARQAAGRNVAKAAGVESPREITTTSRGRALLIGAIVAAVLVGMLGYWLGIGRYTDAPALVGLAESQAAAEAKKAGFTFKVVERKFSETKPMGTVMSTDPGPGGRILPGGRIEATVSKGQERYQVPPLAGETLGDAKNLLKDLKLEVGTINEQFNHDVEAGRVIAIEGHNPGDQVKRGERINLVVSKGKEPTTIPNVVGKGKDDAKTLLEGAGLVVKVTEDWSDAVQPGQVFAQSIPAGDGFKGDEITIKVSKGPLSIPVPNIKGKTKSQAIALLASLGLKGWVNDQGQSVDRLGLGIDWVVQRQDPANGNIQRGGTVVFGP